jgi:hypothetical protein
MRVPPSLAHCHLVVVASMLAGSYPPPAVATPGGNDEYGLVRHRREGGRVLESSIVGTYLIRDDSREGYHDRNRDLHSADMHEHTTTATANVELPDGKVYEVYNAQYGWEYDLTSGTDVVRIPEGTIIYSNGKMNVGGKMLSKANKQQSEEEEEEEEENGFVRRRNLQRSRRNLQGGTRTVLAVRVIVDDGTYNHTDRAGLSDDVFGNGVDPVNLKSQFAACSYNQLKFDKAPNKNVLGSVTPNDGTTSISNGVVDIRVYHPKSAGGNIVRNAVTDEINRVFGVDRPDDLADHVMYCMPGEVIDALAYAYVGGWNSVYSNKWCNFVSVQLHEVSSLASCCCCFFPPVMGDIRLIDGR